MSRAGNERRRANRRAKRDTEAALAALRDKRARAELAARLEAEAFARWEDSLRWRRGWSPAGRDLTTCKRLHGGNLHRRRTHQNRPERLRLERERGARLEAEHARREAERSGGRHRLAMLTALLIAGTSAADGGKP